MTASPVRRARPPGRAAGYREDLVARRINRHNNRCMSVSILKKGFFLLSATLIVWVSSAQAVSLSGVAAVQPAPVLSADHHHATVAARSMYKADARLAGAAHAAGPACKHPCAAGCAAACGHGTAAVGVDTSEGPSFDTPAPGHAQYPPTEIYRDALLRPPRFLRLS